MHEMGIALQIIDIAAGAIPAELKGCRVEQIRLKIGKLSAVVPHCVIFCLEIAAKDTPLENAKVVIDEIPVTARCRSCTHEWQVEAAVFKCPDCRSGDLEMISGRELDVVTMDIADEPDASRQRATDTQTLESNK
jgi:hydrogenase nickel incorporation protein HypA/HybF